jgi:hypothetical protein
MYSSAPEGLPQESLSRRFRDNCPSLFIIGLVMTILFGFVGIQLFERHECSEPGEISFSNFDFLLQLWGSAYILFPLVIILLWNFPECKCIIARIRTILVIDFMFIWFQLFSIIMMTIAFVFYSGSMCYGKLPTAEFGAVISMQVIAIIFHLHRISQVFDMMTALVYVRNRLGIPLQMV